MPHVQRGRKRQERSALDVGATLAQGQLGYESAVAGGRRVASERLNVFAVSCIVLCVGPRPGAAEAAIEEVYRRRYADFLRLGYALLGDRERARDAVQESFAVALRARDSFRNEGSLDGWLWRTFVNVCRQEQRRRLRAVDAEPPEQATNGHAQEWPELRAALAVLPEQERLVVFLRYFGDLSERQIAEALGIERGTVAATLHHAHKKLRDAIGSEVNR
jgi:RNA polymerase sigma factor (sigma-70 family)